MTLRFTQFWRLPLFSKKDIDTFEMDRRMPTHQSRLAAEKKTNIYFIPGVNNAGAEGYVFVVSSSLVHEDFVASLRLGVIPPYAVVVARGSGEPDDATKQRMSDYYGWEE